MDEATLELLREEALVTSESWPYAFRPSVTLARDFDATLRRAGIEKKNVLGRKLTLHSFRHTYATKAAQAVGQNQFLLQRILGHRQIATTVQYCRPAAPPTIVDLAFLTKHNTDGSQTGSQAQERRVKASA